jgi:hypothetical protein
MTKAIPGNVGTGFPAGNAARKAIESFHKFGVALR